MQPSDPIDQLLGDTARSLLARLRLPESTYRLQFHAGFTFRDAIAIIPYLRELGITDCYASPYLKARPGSMHGYDIVDHRMLSPEIGSTEDYAAFVDALHTRGMGQVLDFVPNHMGIAGGQNPWWTDVLENGPSSPYAGFFDIDWRPTKPQLRGKVLLPVLGDAYGKVLEARQLSLRYEAGAFTVAYFDQRFPIAPDTYVQILECREEESQRALGMDSREFLELGSILSDARRLPPRSSSDSTEVAKRHHDKEAIKRQLAALTESSAAVRDFLAQTVEFFNGRQGDTHSLDPLDKLLNDQSYRLSFWRVASDEINYRRFFDVNELAALSVEKPEVFEATHEFILRLVREGKVTGLRIDHPDGLYDPLRYLQRLHEHVVLNEGRRLFESEGRYRAHQGSLASDGQSWQDIETRLRSALTARLSRPECEDGLRRPLYVIVEKILGCDELLPEDWPVYGTSGYDFLNAVNGLFVETAHAASFTRLYRAFTGASAPLSEVVYRKKFLILQVSLSSELHMLANQLDRLSETNRWSRDFTLNSLRHALREMIACFPVYRSYISTAGIHPRDRQAIETAAMRARRKNPAIPAAVFDFVRDMLLLEYPVSDRAGDRADQLRFVGKFQQVTGPVTAKGVEDTSFYVYNRLASLNEVGGNPDQFGRPPALVHRDNAARRQSQPWSFSALSTHDTKRSEDVRARINVLSEMPVEWRRGLGRWARANRKYRTEVDGGSAPDRNDEYLFYQTLVGAWPLGPCEGDDYLRFVGRMEAFMLKAIHEAKIHTSWISPNAAYEDAVGRFVRYTLDRGQNARFLTDFMSFQARVSHYGMLNSLAQTLLKITGPGVADTYQGTELWDFSLVDPDNRRPVDFGLRQRLLAGLLSEMARGVDQVTLARELVERKEDGRIKLYVNYRALHCRRQHPSLFATGEYLPVEVVGSRSTHVFSFLRRLGDQWALVAVPRLLVRLVPDMGRLPIGPEFWNDTLLILPTPPPGGVFLSVFTGQSLSSTVRDGAAGLSLGDVFAEFPIALLLAGNP